MIESTMNLQSSDAQRIHEILLSARRILLVTHVAPDGDAIGSLIGLGKMLSSQGKDVTLTCADPVPDMYDWLPGSGDVVRQASGTYDLIIALDCSDERRMGRVFDHPLTTIPLINIDHHVTNTNYGTVNWVDPSSVSTSQMVLALADALGWVLDQDVATCLLTGLVTDTQSFRTSNVDARAMRSALRLMEVGAPLADISRRTLSQRPLSTVRLWGEAVAGLTLDDGILWTEVTRAMRQRWSIDENETAGLSNLLSSVREGKVVIVFTERDDGSVDVGLRAVPGHDVSQVALRLGGGGHPQAAGCTLQGSLALVRKRVLAEVRSSLRP
jgi:phosphoesterase RecJ-like protein